MLNKKNKSNIEQSLHKATAWLLNTQNQKRYSANMGRYVYAHNLESDYHEASSGWQTAFSVISLLGMHKLTNEEKYLASANTAFQYLKSLQILDSRNLSRFGAIHETVPHSNWSHPRDALSVAWCFLIHHQYSGEQDSLERAEMFANWYMDYAFSGDWPIATCNLGKSPCMTDDLLGSFQSGGILFLLEMFKQTQNINYYNRALKMCDFYVDNFIDERGVITCLIDPIGNNADINNSERWPEDWQKMHQVNDDFGGIALVESYKIFKKEIYKQRASAYFKWLQSTIAADGSFLDPVVEVGSATCIIFLQAFKTIADKKYSAEIDVMINKSVEYLLKVQLCSENPQTSGAFKGMDNNCRNGKGKWINIRVTNYSIIAFLKLLNIDIFPKIKNQQ